MRRFAPVSSPNLPTADVKHVVMSGQYLQFVNALRNIGVTVLKTESCPDVMSQISHHADVVFAHTGNNNFLIEQNQKNLADKLVKLGFYQADSALKLGEKYPDDVKLNCCLFDKYVICGKNNVHTLFTENRKLIRTSQGYAKCSVCVVDEHSVITDDESIAGACKANNIDALLVSKGSVKLNGFDYGFIGGCSGKLSQDTVAFCGDIRTHFDYLKIKSFLSFRGKQIVSLSGDQLTDIGSIIPITQDVI